LALVDKGLCSHLISITTFVVILALSLDCSPPLPYNSIALFLESSLVASHLPLPASRELVGIRL
jgi:hypothetical protein